MNNISFNGYKAIAQSYKKLLNEAEQPPEVKEQVQQTIKALETIADLNEGEITALFNTGAFNNICKAYFLLAMQKIGLAEDQQEEAITAMHNILNETSAEEALTVYKDN